MNRKSILHCIQISKGSQVQTSFFMTFVFAFWLYFWFNLSTKWPSLISGQPLLHMLCVEPFDQHLKTAPEDFLKQSVLSNALPSTGSSEKGKKKYRLDLICVFSDYRYGHL